MKTLVTFILLIMFVSCNSNKQTRTYVIYNETFRDTVKATDVFVHSNNIYFYDGKETTGFYSGKNHNVKAIR